MDPISADTLFAVITAAVAVAIAGLLTALMGRRIRARHDLERDRLQLMGKLIDKFGTAKEFLDFAGSEEGRRLLSPTSWHHGPGSGRHHALRLFQAGIITVFIGFAFLANARLFRGGTDLNDQREMQSRRGWGTLFVMSGLGLGLAAAVARSGGRGRTVGNDEPV